MSDREQAHELGTASAVGRATAARLRWVPSPRLPCGGVMSMNPSVAGPSIAGFRPNLCLRNHKPMRYDNVRGGSSDMRAISFLFCHIGSVWFVTFMTDSDEGM